jgi:hypothetical protein
MKVPIDKNKEILANTCEVVVLRFFAATHASTEHMQKNNAGGRNKPTHRPNEHRLILSA